MGWAATVVVLIALAIGTCFHVVQYRALHKEMKISRRERAAQTPDPKRRRNIVLSLLISAAAYGAIGLAFYLGWRSAGVGGGAIAGAALAVLFIAVAIAFAIKSAWVSRK